MENTMLKIYIAIITAAIFAFCTAVVLHQAIYSIYFRNKVALTHGFSEGIMAGPMYPLLWVTYGLIAVQFISFIAINGSGELLLTLRLILFAISILAFCIFKTLTPPLLALWFGKSAFWDSKGEQGKHLFTDIYCAKVHKDKNSQVINNQQLYKISFYVKGKTAFLFPKKYSCKMTAKQIGSLTNSISFKDRAAKPEITKKAMVYAALLPLLIFLITLLTLFQTVSTGILNSEKYVSSEAPVTAEISTITEISSVVSDNERAFVFYDKVGAVNVYTLTGDYLYSISLPHSVFKHTDICINEDKLLYRYGDEILSYSLNGEYISCEEYTDINAALFGVKSTDTKYGTITFGGNGVFLGTDGGNVTIVTRAAYLSLFSTSFIWPINMLLIISLFMLRYYVTKDSSIEKN